MGLFSRKSKNEDTQPVNLQEVTLSDGISYNLTQQVDCLGDSCPRPQMMTKKALTSAQTNDVVEITVDNPSSMEAVPPMGPQLGATHLETVTENNCWKIYMRKD
jgi:tRNA 2-thiouridine synthesizing protein A